MIVILPPLFTQPDFAVWVFLLQRRKARSMITNFNHGEEDGGRFHNNFISAVHERMEGTALAAMLNLPVGLVAFMREFAVDVGQLNAPTLLLPNRELVQQSLGNLFSTGFHIFNVVA